MVPRRRAPSSPPRLAAWLIECTLPAPARGPVLGDMEERFRTRASRAGESGARRWYWLQAISFVLRVPVARLVRVARRSLRSVSEPPDGGRAVAALTGDRRPRRGHGLAADVRLAARTLGKRPFLSATVVTILAVAVGVNTTVFGVVDAVLLRRLPFPRPDRLVMLWDAYPEDSGMGERSPITFAHFREWRAQRNLFSAVGAYESVTPAIRRGEWPERVDGAMVTAGLLPLLGARAELGRLLGPEDEVPGARPVVLLGHDLWASRFGGDPEIVGREIELNGVPTMVVGVTSPDFWFYDPYSATRSLTGSNAESARLWQPLPAAGPFGGETDYPRYRVIARLRDGISAEEAAQAAVALRRRFPPTSAGDSGMVRLVPLSEQVVSEARPRLLGLFGAVSLVLLIAAVNLVSLLLVHLESRHSEFAVRAALGGSRGRLARQLMVETALLGLAGGLSGLLVAAAGTRWLLNAVPRGLPLAHRVGIGAMVAAWGIGLALVTGLAIGAVTALRLDTERLASGMAGARTATRSRSTRRLHGGLVAVEVALSLVLLISATLLLRSTIRLRTTDTGFRAAGVLTFEATLPPSSVAPGSDFFERLEARITNLPGVVAVGATSALPFSRWIQMAGVEVGGASAGSGNNADRRRIDYRLVSPGYFDAIGLPLRSGRAFGTGDRAGAPAVAVANEAFVAQQLDGDPDPIGRTVTVVRGERSVRTIVGVVGNVKHSQLFERDRPILYVPVLQSPLPFRRFAVRVTAGDPLRLVGAIRRTASELDRATPLQEFIAFDALVAQSIEEETFYTQVIAAFAAAALLLTLVGIYGVISFATRQRDREIGVRMALGARAISVHGLVLGQGLAPVAVGLAVGLGGAVSATGLLRGLLHGVPEQDMLSFAGATLAYAVVAAAACYVPARRAARTDPVAVLRGE